MMRLLVIFLAMIGAARADVPRVVTDIAPVHGLVAEVMAGVGEPELLLRPGASPHDYALRPSDARALQQADLVVWIGEELTPWLDRSLATLAPMATRVDLLNVKGTVLLPIREDMGAAHDHDDHGSNDPHAWLDPKNAKLWLSAIGASLAEADPENAAAYRQNASNAAARIDELIAEVDAALAPVRGRRFAVHHDSYQYFEERFGIHASAAIASSDAVAPGAARLAAVRAMAEKGDLICVFTEPQLNARPVATVTDGTSGRIAMLDPLGSGLEPGVGFYSALIRAIATVMADCLGEG